MVMSTGYSSTEVNVVYFKEILPAFSHKKASLGL